MGGLPRVPPPRRHAFRQVPTVSTEIHTKALSLGVFTCDMVATIRQIVDESGVR